MGGAGFLYKISSGWTVSCVLCVCVYRLKPILLYTFANSLPFFPRYSSLMHCRSTSKTVISPKTERYNTVYHDTIFYQPTTLNTTILTWNTATTLPLLSNFNGESKPTNPKNILVILPHSLKKTRVPTYLPNYSAVRCKWADQAIYLVYARVAWCPEQRKLTEEGEILAVSRGM